MKLIEINIKINFKKKFPKTYCWYIGYRFRKYLKRHFSLGVWRNEVLFEYKTRRSWTDDENSRGYAYYYMPFLREYTNNGTIREKYDILISANLIPSLKEYAQDEEMKLLKYINKKL